jgi:hypothetical protein
VCVERETKRQRQTETEKKKDLKNYCREL